ncbi:MAG: CidA/LrgA family protein [Neisseriaceae bacterium]
MVIKRVRKGLVTGFQVLLISLLWLAADWLHRYWITLIPSSALALLMLLVIISVYDGAVSIFNRGAYFLVAHLTLMFVPLIVLALQYKDFFIEEGLNVLLVMCLSSLTAMVAVVVVMHLLIRSSVQRRKVNYE